MSSAYGIKAIKPTDAEHVLGFANSRDTADDALFEVWNGSAASARVLRIERLGQIQAEEGVVGAPTYSFEADKDTGIYYVASGTTVRTAIGGADVVSVAAAGVTITGTLTVTGEIEAGSAGLHLGDNELQTFGGAASAPDYWMGYSTSATRFEFSSTTGGGGTTDGVVFHVTDGADDVVFTGNITATNIAGTLTTAAQTAITSIGTIGTGTWQGTAVADAYVANNLTIAGGTVNSSVIGGSAPAAGTFTQLDVTAEGDLRLQDASGGQYVGLDAPSTVSSSYTLTLPAGIGSVNQVLSINNTDGTLQWATPKSVTSPLS